MATTIVTPDATESCIGSVRSFGPHGPIYEVLGPAPDEDHKRMVNIQVIHSREKLAYPLNEALEDPLVP